MAQNIRLRDDYRSLTGPEKAACILLSLGEDYAAQLFEHMEDDEIIELSQLMSNLGSVPPDVMERLFIEFAEALSSASGLMGTYDSTERLLARVLGEDRMGGIMDDLRGPAGRTMWDKLSNISEQVLANYLKNEYPQTVAVILSKVRAEHGSRVLALLPESFAMEVIMRMLLMEPVQKEILEDIERTLRSEFLTTLSRTKERDAHETMAEIFGFMDRNTEGRFLAALEERNRESAEKIRSLMFTFDDLSTLDPSGVQVLLRSVEKDKLAIALKGGSEQLKDLFISNMSERAGKMLNEDMASMGPIRVKDIEESQTYVVQLAKDLSARGEIVISDGKGDDELVY